MARQLRIEYPGAIYHIMSRGVNKCTTFVDDEDRRFYLELVSKLCKKGALLVHAYSLETTHFHQLAETPVGDLHRWMQWLLTTYTQRFNKRHGRVGGLWQDRYKAILVEDGEYFLTCSRYIHLNPVKDRIVTLPEQYKWSSFRDYLGTRKETPILQIAKERTLSHFRTSEDYISFVRAGMEQKERDPLYRASAGFAFGSEQFVEKIRMLLEGRPDNPEIPSLGRLRKTLTRPDPETIRKAIEESCKKLSRCQQKRLYAYCLDELTWLTRVEIAKILERTSGGITNTIQSIEKRIKEESEWSDHHRRILKFLGSGL